MKLRGKLESDFKEWLCEKEYTVTESTNEVGSDFVKPLYKVLNQLPLSMRFSLLCDFLEEKGVINCVQYDYDVINNEYSITTYKCNEEEKDYGWYPTKEEAIEKVVDKLNEIWE